MKLDTEQLEVTVLCHMITDAKAVNRVKRMGITDEHFVWIEEGSDMCYHGNLFNLIVNYYDQSGGSLVTDMVLEDKLIEYDVPDSTKGRFMTLWSDVQDAAYDENELHALVMNLKTKRAARLWNTMVKEGSSIMTQSGIPKGLEFVKTCVDTMHDELHDGEKSVERLDISDGAKEYFEKEYTKRRDHPELYRGVFCGLDEIDSQTFGWMPEQIVVLLAASSGGKSIQMLNWANYAHQHEGRNVLYFSFEMGLWLCLLRHLSLAFGVSYKQIKGVKLTQEDVDGLMDKLSEAAGGASFVYDVAMEDPTPDYIDMRIREYTLQRGFPPDLVVVDYIGCMTIRNAPKQAKKHENESAVVTALHRLARRHRVPILTAQQINRDVIRENRRAKQDGKAAAFAQDAASGTQNLMHLAHFVIGMESDRDHNLIIYHPVKMRDAQFVPCAARVDPDHNGIYPLRPDELYDFRLERGFSVNPSGGEQNRWAEGGEPTPEQNLSVVQKGADVAVDWGGTEDKFTEDDLMLNAEDWEI